MKVSKIVDLKSIDFSSIGYLKIDFISSNS